MTEDLATILRDRVADAHPDLDRLLRVATTQGTRIRRRRRLGITFVAAAAVGAVGAGAATTLGGTPRATAPQWADGPSATPSVRTAPTYPALRDGLRFTLPDGLTVVAIKVTHMVANTPPPVTDGYRLVLHGTPAQLRAFKVDGFAALKAAYPHAIIAFPEVHSPLPPSHAAGHRITLHLAGWTLDPSVADDKQSITGPGGAVADVVWRPASAYADWVASTDKGRDPMVWTSTVHTGVFVTVQGGAGTTVAQVRALGESLRWAS